MSEIDYAARVARGIALMDVKWPNWATEIDLEKLDIGDGQACMTAQYSKRHGGFAGYLRGQTLLGLDDQACELHGFNADGQSTGEADDSDQASYNTLNSLWRSEIERRRAQGASAEPSA